jgi:CHAD domain-containing protein
MNRRRASSTVHATTVRDALLQHLETAVKAIRARNPSDTQIHKARKELKRARANLRLLRNAVGKPAYRRENIVLRDAARPLSGVRDAAVLLETGGRLLNMARHGSRGRFLLTIRRALKQARLEARAELCRMNATRASAASLVAAAARMRTWRLEQTDIKSMCSGLRRIYQKGRKALAIVCADPTPENLHEWRKQVKYLGQAMGMWETQGADGVKELIKCADKLADLLGTDHDLVVFEERLEELDAPHPIRPAITRDIAGRRFKLLNKALKRGHRLFKAKPRLFVLGMALRN